MNPIQNSSSMMLAFFPTI